MAYASTCGGHLSLRGCTAVYVKIIGLIGRMPANIFAPLVPNFLTLLTRLNNIYYSLQSLFEEEADFDPYENFHWACL
jgi:hypothetical protein